MKGGLTLCLLLLLITNAFAQQGGTDEAGQPPIEITARQLEALQGQRRTVFTGDVVAKQGDITLYAEKLVILFQDDQNRVEEMVATGQVRVVQLDRVATAEQAVYKQAEGTLVLKGQAEIVQGENRIAGDEIVLYLAENRSVVKSSDSGRVRAVITPEQGRQAQ